MPDIKQKAREMFHKTYKIEPSGLYSETLIPYSEKDKPITDFIDQIIDLAKAEGRKEKNNEILEIVQDIINLTIRMEMIL